MNAWDNINSYNVVYTVPGQTDRSAMPIGNGELCASVWMNEEGILKFYFGRTDSLIENDRTAKLGMVEISTEPSFLVADGYKQSLILEEGKIVIESNLGCIEFLVSSEADTIYIHVEMNQNVKLHARYITWRRTDRECIRTPWMKPAIKKADVIEFGKNIIFYHQNGENGIKELAELQGIYDISQVPDFLTNRIFGGIMKLDNGFCEGDMLTGNGRIFDLRITTFCGQYESVDDWKYALYDSMQRNLPFETARRATAAKWKDFWNKSYLYVEGDEPVVLSCTEDICSRAKEPMECNTAISNVTRAYILTKFMIACCKDGKFPICYNGLLFNLTPGNQEHLKVQTFAGTFTSQPTEEANEEYNPDERSWALEQLWQNLRLPYYTMLYTGDFSSVRSMFDYYLRFQGLNEQRAKVYYNAKGQHNAEMTLTCGLQSASIYGIDRSDKHPGRSENPWGGSIEISPALELLNLMLEYCNYTNDKEFLKNEVVTYARDIFDYIATRFSKRVSEKIYIEDINCVEMFFHTNNPTPIIAGMVCTLNKLINSEISDADKVYFEKILAITPCIPTYETENGEMILPAEVYKDERMNVESPELYTVYPFKLFTRLKGNEKAAKTTFLNNVYKYELMQPHIIGNPPGKPSYSGWQYIGCTAALLGLTDICEEIITNNAALQNPGNRFPAMWGAVHDAVPDADHGANILNLLQHMVMQCNDGKIYLLPAFPEKWNVKFKLYATDNTTVTCEYKDGEIISYSAFPEERILDIVVLSNSDRR